MPGTFTCARPECRKVVWVRHAYDATRRKFCSRRCAGLTHKAKYLTPEIRLRGAEQSKLVRRAMSLERLSGLTPTQIYRQGWSNGWRSGVRYVKRWLGDQPEPR